MSVTFDLFDPKACALLNIGLQVNMSSSSNAGRVGREIGLIQYAYGDHMATGGECTVEQLRECLLCWPDGHPDSYLNMRLGQLTALVDAAAKSDTPGLLITWG